MNQHNLQAEAKKLLQLMREAPPREPGEKLRPIDEATILEMAAAGKSQTEIAQIVGCNQSTVSRTLAEWADSRGLARKYAEAESLEMMQRFVKEASPADILKMQSKLDVVREDKEAAKNTGIVINIGAPGNPIRLPDIDGSED
jgi:Homeodomain-like domain-containing protein